jgi:5'-nucleotidase
MRIALDVDGPTLALHDEWYKRYNRDYDDNLTVDKVTDWNTHQFVKPECGKKIYDYLQQPDLYAHVPIVTGAAEGIRLLRERGHEVLFVTSCTKGMADQKAEALERFALPAKPTKHGLLPDDFCVLTDKRWIDADLLIDDALHNIKDWVLRRRRAILMNYPWNQAAVDVPSMFSSWIKRANTWPEILALVENFG